MEVTLADLQRTYADKTDDDLLHLHGRGTLTDVAYQALEAELTSRGIAVPSRPADAESRFATGEHQDERLRGLGGWLVLLGIGVVLAPLQISAAIVTLYSQVFGSGNWQALTTADSDVYHPLWAPIIIGELVFNLGMLCATLYLWYLFFSKSYLFPRAYIVVALATLIFIPFDAWVITFVLPDEPMFDEATARNFGRALFGSLIWVTYLGVSRRVKATFVEGRRSAVMASSS